MTYTIDSAIEWYTANAFVYQLANQALRAENIELLYLFRSYIIDLRSQLEQEHKQISSTEVCGVLISTNGFFSTSRDPKVALSFIAGSYNTDKKRLILFEIIVDPQLKSVIFADTEKYSRMKDETKVLFRVGAVFTIT
ncbi:unnamed protein product [Rotaria sp. Silwood1]|nr:unnamed protein product [Rotaria sp. Silwood1]CAF4910755.1 unnamed protein product [Rotaria sp. Silwood1]